MPAPRSSSRIQPATLSRKYLQCARHTHAHATMRTPAQQCERDVIPRRLCNAPCGSAAMLWTQKHVLTPLPHLSCVTATTVPLKVDRKRSSQATLCASRWFLWEGVRGCTCMSPHTAVQHSGTHTHTRVHTHTHTHTQHTHTQHTHTAPTLARRAARCLAPPAAAAPAPRASARRQTASQPARRRAGTCGVVWCVMAVCASANATAACPRTARCGACGRRVTHAPQGVHGLLQLPVHLPAVARVQRVLRAGRRVKAAQEAHTQPARGP
jgi:hypothetical protein